MGLFPIGIALNLVPNAVERLSAPRWVAGSAGAVFVLAGCMILMHQRRRLVDALAFVLLLLFALIGLWVALYSPDASMSGGVPLLSRELNGTIGRIVFGGGSVISFALSIYALRAALRAEGKTRSQ